MTSDTEKFMQDIKTVLEDTETLLRGAAGKTNKEVEELHATLSERLALMKDKLMTSEQLVLEQANQAARVTNQYVHQNPWKSAMIAGSIGLLVGYLISTHRH